MLQSVKCIFMKKTRFTMDEINIGDEVLINRSLPVEHNLFWRVVNKISNNRLILEIREMGYADSFIVSVNDIVNLQRTGLAF